MRVGSVTGSSERTKRYEMKRTLLLTGLAAFLCGLPAGSALAQETKPEVKAVAKPEAAPVMSDKEKAEFAKQVDFFVQVASYGEAHKDPLALVTAVRLLDDLPFTSVARPGEGEKSGPPYDRDALIAQAKASAGGDAGLLAIIEKVQDAPEPTAVRGGGHRPPPPPRYYDRNYHERHYRCRWVRECHRGNCEWVCR